MAKQMSKDDIILACAKAAHEMNRVYCEACGDTSQPIWDKAELWQKTSAINGVKLVLNGSTPERQHEAWCNDKINDGWKFGPVKDPVKKEHPCLVPYNQLSKEQKIKDELYINSVLSMSDALEALNV